MSAFAQEIQNRDHRVNNSVIIAYCLLCDQNCRNYRVLGFGWNWDHCNIIGALHSYFALSLSISSWNCELEFSTELKQVMEQNAREMEEMQRSYEERLKAMAGTAADGQAAEAEKSKRMANEPHMWNLNEDASLTNMVQKFCPNGKTLIGNGKEKGEDSGAIVFKGGG